MAFQKLCFNHFQIVTIYVVMKYMFIPVTNPSGMYTKVVMNLFLYIKLPKDGRSLGLIFTLLHKFQSDVSQEGRGWGSQGNVKMTL